MTGLSPRVRGNPPPKQRDPMKDRSIPACAGEPFEDWCLAKGVEVYPRVCGGTSRSLFPLSRPAGLSPRVRGNP